MKPLALADPTDVYVGHEIRRARRARGLIINDIADAIGISGQQVQKYEIGANRVSASMLWQIADVLGMQVADFFPKPDLASVMADPHPTHSETVASLVVEVRGLSIANQKTVLALLHEFTRGDPSA